MKKLAVFLMIFIFAALVYAQVGMINGNLEMGAGDVNSTGTLTGGVVATTSYIDFTTGQSCETNGRLCWDGSSLNFTSEGSTTDIMLGGSGTGYWSETGSDIYYNAGTVTIGATTQSTHSLYATDGTLAKIIEGLATGTDSSTTYYGGAFKASGTGALKNVGIHGYADGATTDWGVWAEKGIGRFDEGIETTGTTSTAADGDHYINFCNDGAFDETEAEGDVYCNNTDDTIDVWFGGAAKQIYPAESGIARFETGTYTGNGTTSQVVSLTASFTPKYCKIWAQHTTDNVSDFIFEATDTILDDNASGLSWFHNQSGGHTTQVNGIIAFGAGSFTVDDDDADSNPNTNAQVYNYYCIGD